MMQGHPSQGMGHTRAQRCGSIICAPACTSCLPRCTPSSTSAEREHTRLVLTLLMPAPLALAHGASVLLQITQRPGDLFQLSHGFPNAHIISIRLRPQCSCRRPQLLAHPASLAHTLALLLLPRCCCPCCSCRCCLPRSSCHDLGGAGGGLGRGRARLVGRRVAEPAAPGVAPVALSAVVSAAALLLSALIAIF